jgi:hypothetical protein
LKTLALIELLIVHLLCTTLLMAGCLKRAYHKIGDDVCKVVMVEKERLLKVRRMTTPQGIRHCTGLPDRMGPVYACDTPVIEMIAKPALPCKGFGDTG